LLSQSLRVKALPNKKQESTRARAAKIDEEKPKEPDYIYREVKDQANRIVVKHSARWSPPQASSLIKLRGGKTLSILSAMILCKGWIFLLIMNQVSARAIVLFY
jgi:hypothetical protein